MWDLLRNELPELAWLASVIAGLTAGSVAVVLAGIGVWALI